MRTTIILLLTLFIAGCASRQATNNRVLNEHFAKSELDAKRDAYADCGYNIATAYAVKDFAPQDIADAAVAECSSQMKEYRVATYAYMRSITNDNVQTRSVILNNLPAHMSAIEEGFRKQAIRVVLEMRSNKIK